MTKVLTVRISPALLSQTDARAAQLGIDRTQYVRQLLEADLSTSPHNAAPQFKSEDLAGRFRLGGAPATNARVRKQWRKRLVQER